MNKIEDGSKSATASLLFKRLPLLGKLYSGAAVENALRGVELHDKLEAVKDAEPGLYSHDKLQKILAELLRTPQQLYMLCDKALCSFPEGITSDHFDIYIVLEEWNKPGAATNLVTELDSAAGALLFFLSENEEKSYPQAELALMLLKAARIAAYRIAYLEAA